MKNDIENLTAYELFLRTKSSFGIHSEQEDTVLRTNRKLVYEAQMFELEGNDAAAEKSLRAAAEFGDDAYAQYELARFYEQKGKDKEIIDGICENTAAAIYWYNRAGDNHIKAAAEKCAALLRTFDNMQQEINDVQFCISGCCKSGKSALIPEDADKAAYWEDEAKADLELMNKRYGVWNDD